MSVRISIRRNNALACLLSLLGYLMGFSSFSVTAQQRENKPPAVDSLFMYTVNDTLSFPIFLKDEGEGHLYFFTALKTNVCNDQVCLPIEVDLYWDLLGNFHHYKPATGTSFTKFDHAYFAAEDYSRLQQILNDTLSVLRDYRVEDLLDQQGTKYAKEVDAVTRPTSPLFADATVPGALYTVYTLWHLVQGPIRGMLRHYLDKHYVERTWDVVFAKSDYAPYQEYFLHHLSEEDRIMHEMAIRRLLFAKDTYVPHYAIKALDMSFWNHPDKYNDVLARLGELQPHVVTQVLQMIAHANNDTKGLLHRFTRSEQATEKHKKLIQKIIHHEKQ